jgi:hypothetical protein
MATQSNQVQTTGGCLGLAFAELSAARRDSHGLVFGSISHETINRVSDRGSNDETRTTISIQAFHPITFISKDGCLDLDIIRNTLDNQKAKLVGWYSYRGNAPLRPSMKEVFVHNKLKSELFDNGTDLLPIFVMLTTSAAVNMSTLSLDCRVVRSCNMAGQDLYRPLELQIKNISHSTRTEYSTFSAHAILHDEPSSSAAPSSSPLAVLQAAEIPPPLVVSLEAYAQSLQARVTELSDLVLRREQVPTPPGDAGDSLCSRRYRCDRNNVSFHERMCILTREDVHPCTRVCRFLHGTFRVQLASSCV